MKTETMMVVTLKANGAWQPCGTEYGPGDRTAQWTCYRAEWVVESDWTGVLKHDAGEPVITFEGFTTEEKAKRYANSMGGPSVQTVKHVAPYWYATAWGRVADELVHPYVEAA